MKRPGHKNFNAVSHNRSRPEVFFNLTWRSRGQISSVLRQLLLFALSNTKFERREMICYVLAMGKQHLGPHVVVGYGIKIFWPGLFITSPDHLECGRGQCLFSRLIKYLVFLSPSLYQRLCDLKIAPFLRYS